MFDKLQKDILLLPKQTKKIRKRATLLAIREMEAKTTVRYHLSLAEELKSKTLGC